MADLIVCLVLAVIIGASVCYIIKAKKQGVKCIGCPAAGECAHKCSGASGGSCACNGDGKCSCHTDT